MLNAYSMNVYSWCCLIFCKPVKTSHFNIGTYRYIDNIDYKDIEGVENRSNIFRKRYVSQFANNKNEEIWKYCYVTS